MVEYYKTIKNYYFKIIKNKKIRISKEEYLKNNKKKGGAYMQPNHIGWVVMMHGLTIAPGQSPHRQYGQDLPRLPLNVALYYKKIKYILNIFNLIIITRFHTFYT